MSKWSSVQVPDLEAAINALRVAQINSNDDRAYTDLDNLLTGAITAWEEATGKEWSYES